MTLKEQLKDTLDSLGPQIIDINRARLELDPSAIAISLLLSEPYGLEWVEYFNDELRNGKDLFYIGNKHLDKHSLEELIGNLYNNFDEKDPILKAYLRYYHQLWISANKIDKTKDAFTSLEKFSRSEAIERKEILSKICLSCKSILVIDDIICTNCGNNDFFELYSLKLKSNARNVMKNGQYLEIYIKECFSQIGIELVGHLFKEKDKVVYISIRYQIDGEEVDADVLGIWNAPLTIFFCEAKTSRKIVMNEIRRVENLFKSFIEKINTLNQKQFNYRFLFVTTGEFDQNIPKSAYTRKNWELLEREHIQNLRQNLLQICNEI